MQKGRGGCREACVAAERMRLHVGVTQASKCSCASFYNVTSGSGLVVTESGGACVLSDSREPWCIVNLTTCKQPSVVRRSRGQPWDYCADPAHAFACGL